MRWPVLRRLATASGRDGILGEALAGLQFGQIGPDGVEVDVFVLRRRRRADLGFLDEGKRRAFEHGVARRHRQPAHDAADIGGDHMLHLHRFHDEERLARMHGIADLDGQRNDRALQRRAQRARAFRRGSSSA